jgi:hypothetical protein
VSINCTKLPNTIRDLLKGLTGKTVTIISKSGDKETVEIEGVIGDILVSGLDGCFKFTVISCICSVIAKCDDLIDAAFAADCSSK